MTDRIDPARRLLLHRSARVAALAAFAVWVPSARAASGARSLALKHTHTGERIDLVYAVGGQYVPGAMIALNRFLRDHYSGEVGLIDPQVFDQLHQLQQRLGSSGAFEVISAYRCPATNARLRAARGGGVAPNSLHLQGRAIDVRLPDTPLADLRDAALSLRGGGVGYYPRERFVHLDTGRVRSW
ncbi:MAG TPA: DUF882 domain-containing protein [Burkholderiaceae bacterium]|nr:DUF882 domain-containing protein [Burkholderiaceae bacterium]